MSKKVIIFLVAIFTIFSMGFVEAKSMDFLGYKWDKFGSVMNADLYVSTELITADTLENGAKYYKTPVIKKYTNPYLIGRLRQQYGMNATYELHEYAIYMENPSYYIVDSHLMSPDNRAIAKLNTPKGWYKIGNDEIAEKLYKYIDKKIKSGEINR